MKKTVLSVIACIILASALPGGAVAFRTDSLSPDCMEILPQHGRLCAVQAASVNSAFKNVLQQHTGPGMRHMLSIPAAPKPFLDISNFRKNPGFRLYWILTPVAVRK